MFSVLGALETSEVESSRTSLASRTHFEVLGLGLKASSPWSWPRSLRSSKITALFFKQLKFCWKTPENSRKICKYLFCFPQLEHRLSQVGLPRNRNFTNDKKPIVSLVSFYRFSLTPVANNNIEDQRPPDLLNSIFASQFKRKPGRNG